MAAKKNSSKSQAPAKKRARFPRTEAALAGLPVPEEAPDQPTTAEPPPAEALAEAAGEAPAAQALAEPPSVEGAGTEATAEGAGAEGTTPDAGTPGPAGAAPEAATEADVHDGKTKKLSALDAAAKVLGEAGQALGCKEMIEVMATKGYWSSRAGKTPAGTLYAAILREIASKGDTARFQKTERGKFALRGAA